MGMFNIREPRRMEHHYIYYDERKEKLRKIEENARRDLGMLDGEETFDPNRIRGKFLESTKHLRRRKQSGAKPVSTPVIIMILVALIILLHYLLTGEWMF
ncbi:MAG: hypothetical protein MJY65_04935 [Bacteroidaceae bacterium]|nr:hypothetical protein [Bacteroidaceae bacterium]